MSAKPAERFTRPLAVPSSGLDMSEDDINRIAAQSGAPTLVHPTPASANADDGAGQGAEPEAPAARQRRVREPVAGKATPRSKWNRISVELPDYLIEEIKMRALKQKSSLRHVVMKALRTQNFTITDADMIEDGRKAKGRYADKV